MGDEIVVLWLGLLTAIGIGALHSLEPGHGKGVLTAYLLSSKANAYQAILLGLLSAIGHTFSILLLAWLATTLKISSLGGVLQWIELASGIVILLIGLKQLYEHVRPRIVVVERVGHGPLERHHHDHHHHHHHFFSHHDENAASPSQLFTIGLMTGLIPCPSAVAVFLAAVGSNQVSYGLSYVVAFSLGTALTMILLGIMAVRVGHTVESFNNKRMVQWMGVASSFFILILGSFILYQSLALW